MAAENQRREVWERLEQARRIKAAQGGYAGYGSPAFGQQAIQGELTENPDEQQIIELIRRHHKSGKSLQQVADWLNQSGYQTKRGSSGSGSQSSGCSIGSMAECPNQGWS